MHHAGLHRAESPQHTQDFIPCRVYNVKRINKKVPPVSRQGAFDRTQGTGCPKCFRAHSGVNSRAGLSAYPPTRRNTAVALAAMTWVLAVGTAASVVTSGHPRCLRRRARTSRADSATYPQLESLHGRKIPARAPADQSHPALCHRLGRCTHPPRRRSSSCLSQSPVSPRSNKPRGRFVLSRRMFSTRTPS